MYGSQFLKSCFAIVIRPVQSSVSYGETSRSSIAASAVTGLKVDPAGYVPAIALSTPG